ncbi:tyrosine-type recombinase/integrase [Actinocrinis puniceicyclus]|uniref:Tyrosine-type recombinase/integrase n=1 Tax=Actinocrinis puniceicyclus TaxID=977794 RepID=A0A8J8BBA0_9ACTN|nr:tyrosine-type recombinase/integrase [Actinocrinis puniceicyclus]MBS2963817.1 tyrosine-type recombinase/integrase [Actinocrinis puniceicyclus]
MTCVTPKTGNRITPQHLTRREVVHRTTTRIATRGPSHTSTAERRHTNAMSLLRAGVDTTVIALWLGHADTRSTQPYLHADMTIKERALARTTPPHVKPGRYRPNDELLAFLEGL